MSYIFFFYFFSSFSSIPIYSTLNNIFFATTTTTTTTITGFRTMNIDNKRFYEILELSPNAKDLTEESLKKAYKQVAMKYHPDRPKTGAAEKFVLATKAYETLKDQNLRSIYDKYGEKGLEAGFQPPQQQNEGAWSCGRTSPTTPSSPNGKFPGQSGYKQQQMFAEEQRRARQERVARKNFGSFNVEEAMRRFQQNFGNFDVRDFEGVGLGGHANINKRTRQHEQEQEQHQQQQEGDLEFHLPCTLEELYSGCKKDVHLPAIAGNQSMEVTIKPGWKHGTRLTWADKGSPRRDGTSGDLKIVVNQKPHAYFRPVENTDDLEFDVELPVSRALCGFRCTVEGVDGKPLVFETKNVSKPGKTYRISQRGMPNQKDPSLRGDAIVRVNTITFPSKLTEKQRDAIKAALE